MIFLFYHIGLDLLCLKIFIQNALDQQRIGLFIQAAHLYESFEIFEIEIQKSKYSKVKVSLFSQDSIHPPDKSSRR